jgi:adenylate cyclase
MTYRSGREGRARQKLHRTIAGYVGPEILREMLAEPATWLRSLNQRREVTILFSDINDFSTFSEQESPEVVAEWLNHHYREMAHLIFEHQGTIIRFVGDQFMVLFGSPKPLERPESAAVACALAMHKRLAQLREASKGGGFFDVKIGIHRGSMLLAVIGDDLKRDYTAIGDEANLAARIQDLCKTVGQSTLLSQEIVDRLREGEFALSDQGEWPVKGRRQKVRVYGVSSQ